MTGKFYSLVATAMLVALAATGCHHNACSGSGSLWGGRYHDVGGACQKGACQKSVCQKGGGECDGDYRGHHFLSSLHSYFWCSGGCGEVYCGEWLYDPPDCCDPCDDCYGSYVGPRDCCKRKWIIDPSLWLLAIKHKHCRQGGCYDPCGNWHCDCDCGDCGGCGKGGCGCSSGGFDGGYEGDYLEGPLPEAIPHGAESDDIPDPAMVNPPRTGRVASREAASETRQAAHALRR